MRDVVAQLNILQHPSVSKHRRERQLSHDTVDAHRTIVKRDDCVVFQYDVRYSVAVKLRA